MKKLCLVVICLMAGSAAQAALTQDWSEGFSSNPLPAWSQTGSGIYWNSDSQNLTWGNYGDSSSSFSRVSSVALNEDSEFQLTLNYQPDYTWSYSNHVGGLSNSGGNGAAQFWVSPHWNGTANPTQYDVFLGLQNSDGGWSVSPTLVIGGYTTYLFTMDYTPAAGLSMNIKDESNGDYGTIQAGLPVDKTFTLNQVKLYDESGGGGDFNAYADNVSLSYAVPEPMTIGLLTLGGLMLRRRNG